MYPAMKRKIQSCKKLNYESFAVLTSFKTLTSVSNEVFHFSKTDEFVDTSAFQISANSCKQSSVSYSILEFTSFNAPSNIPSYMKEKKDIKKNGRLFFPLTSSLLLPLETKLKKKVSISIHHCSRALLRKLKREKVKMKKCFHYHRP